jgi:hypothetical protein
MNENQNQGQNTYNSNEFTNDYNQLYGSDQQVSNAAIQPIEQQAVPVFEETPIVFEEQAAPVEVVADVIPTFDTSVLEELPDDLKPVAPEEPLLNTIAKETQQEKAQQKRNITFIVILFAVLAFAVIVIFPMLLDI